MAGIAQRIEQAALSLIGVPFRLHGRDERTGVDCIGLVWLALEGAGCSIGDVPASYSVRGGSVAHIDGALRGAGFRRVRKARAGDIVLVQAGVAQMHLMIASARGHIHAHAGLGRVVEMPGASPWPQIMRWRRGR